jgi:hypothetical protein
MVPALIRNFLAQNAEPTHSVHFCTEFPEQNARAGVISPLGILYNGRAIVLGKAYFTKQASILLEFARSTSNPQLSAKLVNKAADLKSKADPLPEKDQSLRAPDVDPLDETGAT